MRSNFFRCTDSDGKIPSLCYDKPDRPTWVKYVGDKPVSVNLYYPEDTVWDYTLGHYVPVTGEMRRTTPGRLR